MAGVPATGGDVISYVSMTSDGTDKCRRFEQKHGLVA
jgi:hypothetical protein